MSLAGLHHLRQVLVWGQTDEGLEAAKGIKTACVEATNPPHPIVTRSDHTLDHRLAKSTCTLNGLGNETLPRSLHRRVVRIHKEPCHKEQPDAEQCDGKVGVDRWVHRTDVPHHRLLLHMKQPPTISKHRNYTGVCRWDNQ